MSRFALERLDASHDRKRFHCGLKSIDRYLKETARGHTEKGVALTRVMIEAEATAPKPVLGFFTLTPCLVETAGWPAVPKGLPRNPVGAILLGRLGVDQRSQGQGIGSRLLALARAISFDSVQAVGGIGMIVDPASEELVSFYENHGFVRISQKPLRLFLPTRSLVC